MTDQEERDYRDQRAQEYGAMQATLGHVVEWWDRLPPQLRQDIEGSGAEPGCIARARRLSQELKN